MITVNNFSLSDDFTTITISLTAGNGYEITDLKLYMGSDYLSSTVYADLNTYLSGNPNSPAFDITVDTAEVALVYDKDVFDGIFTIVAKTDEGIEDEFTSGATIINAYYTSICLANKILAVDSGALLNETNLLYLLIDAAITYVASSMTEQAIAAYERAEAICNAAGADYLQTEVLPYGEGTGCWIIDGVYVIKR